MHRSDRRAALATSLSTHRIRTRLVAQRIVASTGLAPPTLVVEVGAGEGTLTAALAARGLRVVAIERDRQAWCALRDRFADVPGVVPILADFLAYPLPAKARYAVFGNAPFSITSPILRRLLSAANEPEAIFLVVQREAAFRWGGFEKESLLSLTTRLRYHVEVRLALRRRDFEPVPAADCVLLAMTRRTRPILAGVERRGFLELVSTALRGRHRTVSHALDGILGRHVLAAAANRVGFDLARAPSEPKFEDWVDLCRAVYSTPGHKTTRWLLHET